MYYRIFLLLFPLFLFSFEGYLPSTPCQTPWFTGPLLSGSGNTAKYGTWSTQPYITGIERTGFYNSDWDYQSDDKLWVVDLALPMWVGFTRWTELKVTPVFGWNHDERGPSRWVFKDLFVHLGIQLYRDQLPTKTWLPSMKLSIRERIPTGKYRNLNPSKLGVDEGGWGSWITTLGFNASKVLYFYDFHFLNICFNMRYSIPASLHVKGFNTYGGGYGTDGTIYPEQTFQTSFALEYSLSRNWGISLDALANWDSKVRFKGNPGFVVSENPGFLPLGIPMASETKASFLFTLAPAIEYNWSENLGLIAGPWFTVVGKNSPRFVSAIIALSYTV